MNWNRLQTYGLSPEKSFEMLCNQLFENWCKEKYKDSLLSFTVVNGAGGDGGVESYAVLSDSSIIGLQAKWFLNRIESNQISQIRGSLRTAKKVRPAIVKYIVCVPRDLASKTDRGDNTESKRWEQLVADMKKEFPDVIIDLWNDTRITSEMQKAHAAGIHKFWFENSEINSENIIYAFNKAKASWLSAKYVPDLDVTGQINTKLRRFIGDYDTKQSLINCFSKVSDLCRKYNAAVDNLISVCIKSSPEVIGILYESQEKLSHVQSACEEIIIWLTNEFAKHPVYEKSCFRVSYESIIRALQDKKLSSSYYFHAQDVINLLGQLSNIDYTELLDNLEQQLNDQCIIFLGNPGTGKTHGVSSFVDNLLLQRFHLPIIIQARSIPDSYTWKDILVSTLGLSAKWEEGELWQALCSAANRGRFNATELRSKIAITPKILIIVDGVDECASFESWINRVKETEIITKGYSQIRFCFTSRPHVFSKRIDYANVVRLNEAGDVPVCLLFDIYMKKYGITIQNCQWLKYALNTPLSLKLFCELNQGQCVNIARMSEVSMNRLWRAKIEKIQDEYNRKTGASPKNQCIFRSIVSLSKCFVEERHIERSDVIASIRDGSGVSEEIAETLLEHLEAYGIIGSYCQKGSGLSPDTFRYYSGIQGYFDYAAAMHLLADHNSPAEIDFENCEKLEENALYCLAVISMQQCNYLITQNPTIKSALDYFEIADLQFYALQHSDPSVAIQYKKQCLEYMCTNAEKLTTVVNNLVLPLSRISGHPLGVALLDECLFEYEEPAQRDVLWSLPAYLRYYGGAKWDKTNEVSLLNEDDAEYLLTADDTAEGLPVVYAWLLSSVSNPIRKKCRDKLMIWARMAPHQFFDLFLRFSSVNDPQIMSDLFSILMCLVYDCADAALIKKITEWVLENTLSPAMIDRNRDISVRYYATGIIEKAKQLGLYSLEDLKDYLPPYKMGNLEVKLNKAALSGTRMGGYRAIHYDLARYVLIDHFEAAFNSWNSRQLENLAQRIGKSDPEYTGMTAQQFIISAAYAYICDMGWSEDEFYSFNKDEAGNLIGGVDISISASHPSATHGAQSNVMTVCEKYVWAARNYISGFLCDRLPFGDTQCQITDYNLLDDFMIPIQEVYQIDPDNVPSDRPWHIPEPLSVMPDKELGTKESIANYIRSAPDIDWTKWIHVDNGKGQYSVPSSSLLALMTYSCFYEANVETCLFMNSIVVPTDEVAKFVEMSRVAPDIRRILVPSDWDGDVDASCYITPKEVCWFPWKKHFDSHKINEYPNITIHSAIDSCSYNYPEYGDVHYSMPSAILRSLLGIIDTDGYHYFDKDKKILSEYSITGEKWRTTQEYVLLDKQRLLDVLSENGLSLVWIMQEMRREAGTAREKLGDFYAEKRQYCIGYYVEGEFVIERLLTDLT